MAPQAQERPLVSLIARFSYYYARICASIVETLNCREEKDDLTRILYIGIVAVAKHLYGQDKYKNMILELNASDDRGINVVREQIKSFCSTQQLMSKGIKLVILDECDSMTSSAQFALRRSKSMARLIQYSR